MLIPSLHPRANIVFRRAYHAGSSLGFDVVKCVFNALSNQLRSISPTLASKALSKKPCVRGLAHYVGMWQELSTSLRSAYSQALACGGSVMRSFD